MFPLRSFSPQQDTENTLNAEFKEKIKGWIGLSRPPFHTVGVLPFILGTFLAWKVDGVFSNTIFILGVCAVILILLSTYHAGEYFDHEEDRISKKLFHSLFSGGSGVIPAGIVSRKVPLWTSLITFALAATIGNPPVCFSNRPLHPASRLSRRFPRFLLFYETDKAGRKRIGRIMHRLLLRLASCRIGLLHTDGIYQSHYSLDRRAYRTDNIQCDTSQ